MLWPLSVVLVANTNGRLAIPALAGLLVFVTIAHVDSRMSNQRPWTGGSRHVVKCADV